MSNKILDVLIAITYALCTTVYTGQLVGWQTLMSYKKVFLFCEIRLVNVQHFW